MTVFDIAMKTKSMRKAARVFSTSLELTDQRSVDAIEVAFISGAGWAWQQIGMTIADKRAEARLLFEDNSLMRKP